MSGMPYRLKSFSELRRYLAQRNITVVLLCPDPFATRSSVFRQLYQGVLKPPRWLHPVEVREDAKWRAQDASHRAIAKKKHQSYFRS